MYCVYSLEIASTAILMSTLNIQLVYRKSKKFPKLSLFASWPGAMIKPQWLECPYLEQISTVPKMFEQMKFDCMCIFILYVAM